MSFGSDGSLIDQIFLQQMLFDLDHLDQPPLAFNPMNNHDAVNSSQATSSPQAAPVIPLSDNHPRSMPHSTISRSLNNKNKFPSFQRLFTSSLRRQPHSSPATNHDHQKSEVTNPLFKTAALNQFTDLPGELLHIILAYCTHSFIDILKFATINKICKDIADYSLLWIHSKLVFYPPKPYMRLKGYHPPTSNGSAYEEYIESQIHINFLPTLEKQVFLNEQRYPPVYKVHVTPFHQHIAHYQTTATELHYEFAHRVRNWWIPIYSKYQSLYRWYITYAPYFTFVYEKTNNLNRNFHYVLLFTIAIGIASIYLLFDCNSTDLSMQNQIGFFLLIGLFGVYLFITLLYMLNGVAEGVVYNYESLSFRWKHSYIYGLYIVFLVLTGVIVTVCLVLGKCVGSIGDSVDWWMTVLPMWITFLLSYLLWYTENRETYDLWDLSFKIAGFYLASSPPLTATLIATYYDDIYLGNFGYTLLPLYPMFLLGFIGLILRLIYTGILIVDLFKGNNVGYGCGSSEWLNNFLFFCIFNATNLCCFLSSWSIVMLLIESYWMNNDDWDKSVFYVHFTPLTCSLLFLFSCPCILIGLFLEDMYNY